MASKSEASVERENEEDGAVSMVDVLQEEQQREEDANAVLGDSDDKNCTYHEGYVTRQALYACATCVESTADPAGVCLACSLDCHDGHQLYELYTKRHFRCDCGNGKFGDFKCKICPEKDKSNAENRYDQNFKGLYCSCSRPYPDPEDDVEDDMIQCVVCEDWHHGRHLGSSVPANDQYDEMICAGCMDRCQFLWSYSPLGSGKPNQTEGKSKEDEENMKKCRACLSTLLHLNEVSTPQDKWHQMTDLVQVLVDGKIDAELFESQARELLKTQAEPFLVPFLDKSLLVARWVLNKKEAKIPGVTPPADDVPMTKPSSDNRNQNLAVCAISDGGEEAADNLHIRICVDFLTTVLELASQLDPKMHSGLLQAVQQLVDDKLTTEEFHQKLSGMLSSEKSPHLAPMLESSLPKLRWSLLNGGEQLAGIKPPDKSAPVQAPADQKEEGGDAAIEVVEVQEAAAATAAAAAVSDMCHLKVTPAKDATREKGATFWPENWRNKLCQCSQCKELYESLRVSFLLDSSDTIHAYEERGKQRVVPLNQYEKGMRALSGMDRTQQVEVLHEYNDLKTELSDYLKTFAESGKVVREEDIREFFSDLQARKRQKTSGGMQYFCK